MGLLERYKSGEIDSVYQLLLQERRRDSDADAVATEIMRRVRQNLETLAERWRAHGFMLRNPLGPVHSPEVLLALDELAQAKKALPTTLAALYREVGWVDFIAMPPEQGWPDQEALDPIEIEDLPSQIDEIVDDDGPVILFGDPLVKFGISGVGDIFVQLPAPEFDPELWFEDAPMQEGNGTPVCLVPYLREAILVRGGIGPFGAPTEKIDAKLRAQLTSGLLPF